MIIQSIPNDFSVCKVEDYSLVNWRAEYVFTAKTDEENSLVCLTQDAPANTMEKDDGWRALRVQGTLDFALVGILAGIAQVLAQHKIPIFAISTYNTDYIFVKEENFAKALKSLAEHGYKVINEKVSKGLAALKNSLPSENVLYKLLRPELEAALKSFVTRQHSANVSKFIGGFLKALDTFAKGKKLQEIYAFTIVQELEDNNYTQLNFYLDTTTFDIDCCGFVEQDGLVVNSYNNWELSIDGAACEAPDVFDYDMVNELVEILQGDKVRLEIELPEMD